MKTQVGYAVVRQGDLQIPQRFGVSLRSLNSCVFTPRVASYPPNSSQDNHWMFDGRPKAQLFVFCRAIHFSNVRHSQFCLDAVRGIKSIFHKQRRCATPKGFAIALPHPFFAHGNVVFFQIYLKNLLDLEKTTTNTTPALRHHHRIPPKVNMWSTQQHHRNITMKTQPPKPHKQNYS